MNTPQRKPPQNAVIDTPLVVPPSPCLKSLGFGTGVSVVQLLRAGKSPWAVKRVKKENMRVYITKRLREEAAVLKQMNHPNVVGFRRFQKLKDGRLGLAMESCGTSLGDRIEERAQEGLQPYKPSQILKVALDIGKALDYIHTKVKILHGDVKSFNILVNGDFEICKLCDFGVHLPLDENGVVNSPDTDDVYIGTECWSAPEALLDEGLITNKADIFSFGLTLWEMLALEAPHVSYEGDDSSDYDYMLDDSQDMWDGPPCELEDDPPPMNYGTRPAIPECIDEKEYKDVLSMFYCMTVENPINRPHASQIVSCVEDLQNV